MVLHELAHGLVGGGHDGRFCSTYLKLVRRFMGQEAWFFLKYHFDCLEVKCRHPPRYEYDLGTGEIVRPVDFHS